MIGHLQSRSRRDMRGFARLVLLLLILPGVLQAAPRTVHLFVALADNQNQGIIPVPAVLGNGRDPQRNLYWGAAYGVKTFFKASKEWELVSSSRPLKAAVLERCIFRNRRHDVFLVADAYEGSQIRLAVSDFLFAAAGRNKEEIPLHTNSAETSISIGGAADLIVYLGHDAFMDFQIPPISGAKGEKPRYIVVLACASKEYFASYIRQTGSEPLLWTTGLMAPEAYTLEGALDGWIAGENGEAVRQRAAQAYNKYQKCGERAANKLFATGW
jgi:hypothetical protein